MAILTANRIGGGHIRLDTEYKKTVWFCQLCSNQLNQLILYWLGLGGDAMHPPVRSLYSSLFNSPVLTCSQWRIK